MQLTENQTAIIAEKINEAGLEYYPLREELLDHLCCATEEKMIAGASFPEALDALSELFKEDEMKDMEKETLSLLNSKSEFMKKLSLLTLLVLLLTFTMTWATKNSEQPILPADPPSILPIAGDFSISSSFGKRMHPIHKVEKMHNGTDFKAPMGTPVLATSDGKIIKAETKSTGYGNNIVIEHDSIYQSRYGQLSEINVKVGQLVKKGDVIGKVGSSGTSTGPHLHYEVIENGKHVNPENFLSLRAE